MGLPRRDRNLAPLLKADAPAVRAFVLDKLRARPLCVVRRYTNTKIPRFARRDSYRHRVFAAVSFFVGRHFTSGTHVFCS